MKKMIHKIKKIINDVNILNDDNSYIIKKDKKE